MAAVALAQLWLAHHYFGFLTGDDVEVLAAAFRRAFGFEYTPWDVRNLFVPEVIVAPVLRLANAVGVVSSARLLEIAVLPFIALNALTILLVHRLAARWSDDDALAAGAATLLFALHWLPLMFGSTVYPRTIAAACVVGAALLLSTHDSRSAALAAGVLAGLAFTDRFSEIVFLFPLVILSREDGQGSVPSGAARDRYGSFATLRMTLVVIGAAVTILFTVGIYDWITWGVPFSTIRNFARLTLVAPDFSSRVKYQSPVWYLETLPRWCALTMLPLLYAARKRAHLTFLLIPLVVLSLIRHKELRYVQGLVPFLAIAAGIGFAVFWRSGRRKLAVTLLALSLAWNLYGLKYLGRKSMPAVMAARMLSDDPHVRTIALSQIWAYGDRLYFGDRRQVRDVLTPPRDLAAALPGCDAVSLYESDLTPEIEAQLRAHGFARTAHFDTGVARAVVVYTARHGQR
jgi:glycosyl transferase family 22 (putative mannosyltransferase)